MWNDGCWASHSANAIQIKKKGKMSSPCFEKFSTVFELLQCILLNIAMTCQCLSYLSVIFWSFCNSLTHTVRIITTNVFELVLSTL